MQWCKTLTPCITWESALLLPTHHKRNLTDSEQQPQTQSPEDAGEVVEGSGQLVTHPLLPYPHAATFIHTGSLPGYKSWWHNDTQEKSKNGLKQEIAMKSAMGLHTEDTIKGH